MHHDLNANSVDGARANGALLLRHQLEPLRRPTRLMSWTTRDSAGADCRILAMRNYVRSPGTAGRPSAQLRYRSFSKAAARAPRPL